jgi:acetamidase/formamidase
MQRIPRDLARKYAFDWRDQPLLTVERGESFEIETFDASTGYFKTADDKAVPAKRPGFDRVPAQANPIGGPVFLKGAERGDVLVIAIEDILVEDYSWIAIGPRRGPLGESTRCPSSRGNTRPKSSGTHRARAGRRATARCTSMTKFPGRLRPSSGRWGSHPIGK